VAVAGGVSGAGRGLRCLRLGLLAAVVATAGGTAAADESGGQTICLGRYALCSSAECHPIENEPESVRCDCEVPPEGLNVGNSSCQSRAASLTSTFSLWDLTATETKAAKRSLACTGELGGPWAFCLDARCTETDAGGAECTCDLRPASDYYTFTDRCPETEAERRESCGKIWSAALQTELLSGYTQLWSFYADIPELEYCPR